MITNLASFFFHQIQEGEQEHDRVYEPVIGVVTDNKDPDKLLRVKVKIPSLSAQDTTFWVSVISYGAGKDRGWFFMPEVNDEVLVAFEHGDMNHPIIIGAMWNGKDEPPEDSSGANNKRTLVSRSGSKIELDDSKNTITITDGGGKGSIIFKADDNKLLIEAKSGDVFLMAPAGKLQIVGKKGVSFEASANLDIRGSQKANLSGQNVTMKSSGPMGITGGTVNINNGGAEAKAASTSPAETPDPAT
jgi:uncharacterized protein involved in type VI secretion and phage assembly